MNKSREKNNHVWSLKNTGKYLILDEHLGSFETINEAVKRYHEVSPDKRAIILVGIGGHSGRKGLVLI